MSHFPPFPLQPRLTLPLLAFASLFALTCGYAWSASAECCQHCGCNAHLTKVCRLVCDTKKVTETHYAVKCDDVCIHGRSQKCGCEKIPTCCKVKTVKKLMKYETTREVPTYKCVVETICCVCAERLAALEQAEQARAADRRQP